jgi:hypothetical protein
MKIKYNNNDKSKSFLSCNDFVFIMCMGHGHVFTCTFVRLDHKMLAWPLSQQLIFSILITFIFHVVKRTWGWCSSTPCMKCDNTESG